MSPTKEHIILIAFKLFLQKGFKEVTMSMLVKATGLSKGAFYHYFENKEQLFIETLDNLFFSISPFNKEMVVNPEVSFYDYMHMYIDNVNKMAKMIKSYLGKEAVGMGYYRLMLDIANYAPDFKQKIELSNKNEMIFWKKCIEYGIKKGELKDDINIELLANHFNWLQDGIALNTMITRDTVHMTNHLGEVFEQLYTLIKK